MNRKLHNTFSALSVAVALMTAGLIAATPAPQPDPVVARTQIDATMTDRVAAVPAEQPLARQAEGASSAEVRAQAIERAALARAKNIEARAEALARKLEGNRDVGQILGQVAGFTAEVATEAALNAAIEEFISVETREPYLAPSAPPSKPRHSRRSLAMPYFSFANRG